MLIDFAARHSELLVPYQDGHHWCYRPINQTNPRTGGFLSVQQLFSNNALQVGIYCYNSIAEGSAGRTRCPGVSHSLRLTFSRKVNGEYLLADDESKITFNLDIGHAKRIYAFAQGHVDSLSLRFVRPGKAVRELVGRAGQGDDGSRTASLLGVSGGQVEVHLSESQLFALAAYSLAYGRFLYPALSDTAIQQLMTPAIAPVALAGGAIQPTETAAQIGACADSAPPATAAEDPVKREKLKRVVWAIGNQKWPSMRLEALQRIQNESTNQQLQQLIEAANKGDFSGWNAFL